MNDLFTALVPYYQLLFVSLERAAVVCTYKQAEQLLLCARYNIHLSYRVQVTDAHDGCLSFRNPHDATVSVVIYNPVSVLSSCNFPVCSQIQRENVCFMLSLHVLLC